MSILNNPSTTSPRQRKYRTRMCRYLASGDCPFGAKCKFFHPAPSANPSCSDPAPHLPYWSPPLFPQLLALSGQQEILGTMPPPYQGLQFVDEDPSPTTSLLLSKPDSTPLEEMPPTKRSIKRKRFPCRHFVRTGGWCPAGEHCRFHHDVAALPSKGAAKNERAPPFAPDAPTGGRTISGGVLMGIQPTSPPIISQAQPEPPQPTEPDLIPPRSSSRPAYFSAAPKSIREQFMYWPNYAWQPYHSHCPIPASAPPSVLPRQDYTPFRSATPKENRSRLPSGSYEANGTTYFPAPMPSVPAPPPVTYPDPLYPATFDQAMFSSSYPFYAPPTLHTSYYNDPKETTGVAGRTSFDPFGSDPLMPINLPVIPRLEDYQISPIQDVFPLPRSSTPPWNDDRAWAIPSRWPTVSPEHEFPYQPPKDQRVGHARRISVTIKNHGRAHSG